MRKLILIAAALGLSATPAMAESAGEGRVEVRGGLVWAGGASDEFVGVAAGYDFDLGETAFAGPEVAYDTDLSGFNAVNLGGRVGAKVGDGRLYVAAGYDVGDLDQFNAGVGYQHSFGDKIIGKVEYRRYFFNGTDLNAGLVGIGVKF